MQKMHLSWVMLLIVSAAAKNTTVSIQSNPIQSTHPTQH
jgi:hypothetical protein